MWRVANIGIPTSDYYGAEVVAGWAVRTVINVIGQLSSWTQAIVDLKARRF